MNSYRTVWISDVHLGTRDCRVQELETFLARLDCDHLFLVGDVVDVWSLKRRWYWPESHNAIVQRILKCDLGGARVTFVPGNHDEMFRAYDGMDFGGVAIRNEVVHETADGKKVLVIHGDDFDAMVTHPWLVRFLGDQGYYVLLGLNRMFNKARRRLNLPYRSLATWLKSRVPTARKYVEAVESYVARLARDRGMDAVVCGHIHRPAAREIDGVAYLNCGDWVESGTAIVEHWDGTLALIDATAGAPKLHAVPSEPVERPEPEAVVA